LSDYSLILAFCQRQIARSRDFPGDALGFLENVHKFAFTFPLKTGTMPLPGFKKEDSAMRGIEKRLDRFCLEHPNFGIPNLMTVLVIGSIVVFLLDMFSGGTATALLAFQRNAIFHGQVWRLVSFVFVTYSGDAFSLALSLYFYWWIGSMLEREWGTARFSLFYLLGVAFNIVFGLIAGSASTTYLNLSMFFAFALLWPDMQVLLFFFIPVKIKWLAWIDAAVFALSFLQGVITLRWTAAFLPVIAILNFLLFFWSSLMDAVGYRKQRFQYRHSAQTVNFHKATQQSRQQKGYIHKCAVCGKTDTEYPDLEFRYCSKCNGYYCYCPEHIQNHIHVP